jgi:hypothetical protein
LLGLKDNEHPAVGLVVEEQQLRAARETLAVTMRQTAKVLHYHQASPLPFALRSPLRVCHCARVSSPALRSYTR